MLARADIQQRSRAAVRLGESATGGEDEGERGREAQVVDVSADDQPRAKRTREAQRVEREGQPPARAALFDVRGQPEPPRHERRIHRWIQRRALGRPTRDRVFKLSGWQSVDTQPFFMPTLPLAAFWAQLL